MKAKSIEIVTHCYCPPSVPQYAEMLRWQFASLYRNRPPIPTSLTVCYTSTDTATSAVIAKIGREFFESNRHDMAPLTLKAVDLQPEFLFRRAIGRNFVALGTKADVVWYTDVDYCFGPGCIETVADLVGPDDPLQHPRDILIHTKHAWGDEDLWHGRDALLPQVDPKRFTSKRQKMCIGGVQIVGGDTARALGYCKGSKWVKPVDPIHGFRSCRGDKYFRRANKLSSRALEVPSVYRLRHTQDGRDFDECGTILGREVW